jgi:hypothetical protein
MAVQTVSELNIALDSRLWLGHGRMDFIDLLIRRDNPCSMPTADIGSRTMASYNYIELRKELTDIANPFVAGSILITILVSSAQETPLPYCPPQIVGSYCRSVIARF